MGSKPSSQSIFSALTEPISQQKCPSSNWKCLPVVAVAITGRGGLVVVGITVRIRFVRIPRHGGRQRQSDLPIESLAGLANLFQFAGQKFWKRTCFLLLLLQLFPLRIVSPFSLRGYQGQQPSFQTHHLVARGVKVGQRGAPTATTRRIIIIIINLCGNILFCGVMMNIALLMMIHAMQDSQVTGAARPVIHKLVGVSSGGLAKLLQLIGSVPNNSIRITTPRTTAARVGSFLCYYSRISGNPNQLRFGIKGHSTTNGTSSSIIIIVLGLLLLLLFVLRGGNRVAAVVLVGLGHELGGFRLFQRGGWWHRLAILVKRAKVVAGHGVVVDVGVLVKQYVVVVMMNVWVLRERGAF
mmetsp:Transcript_22080/g.47800  ORF Transcript_22080/g.47800 Transcript_22080/m.47800 type:complete len:354 (+) Transcript_22080:117-1178(+)